jgi:hypothetical protein
MIKDCGTLLIDMVNQNVDDGPDFARLFTLVLENRDLILIRLMTLCKLYQIFGLIHMIW